MRAAGTGASSASGCASSRPRSSLTPSARKRCSSKTRAWPPARGPSRSPGTSARRDPRRRCFPLPADDGDLAARVQHAEHQPHLPLAPPAVRPRASSACGPRSRARAAARAARARAGRSGGTTRSPSGTRSTAGRAAGRGARIRAFSSGRSSTGQMNASHSTSFRSSQISRSSSSRSYGPSRLQRTRYCGGATVEIGSICRKPSRRTVSSTPRGRAVEQLRAHRDAAGLLG